MLTARSLMSCVNTADPPAAAGIRGDARSAESALPESSAPDLLVVGLGNPILGDDGIGWRVAEAVREAMPGIEVECLALGGLSLMERLVGYRRAIIIDAIQTRSGRSGDVYTLPLDALPNYSAGHTTAIHDTSLQNALDLGRRMGAVLPARIDVVAIEAERVFDFSETLSPAVAAAIPTATAAVAALVDALRGEPHDLA
jgi:hydrogenase maturation protease